MAAPAAEPGCGGAAGRADAEGTAAEATRAAAAADAVRLPVGAPRLVLGSSSAPRRAILAASGASFDVLVPDIDERAIGDRSGGAAEELVRLVAEAKADALAARLANGGDEANAVAGTVLLTGDQVVTYCGAIREKPVDADQARQFIESYASAPCTTVGALCLHDVVSGRRVTGVQRADIHFGPGLTAAVVGALARDPAILRCAGGLMVEHPEMAPHIERIDGGRDSVMGLSTRLVVSLLGELGAPGEPAGPGTAG